MTLKAGKVPGKVLVDHRVTRRWSRVAALIAEELEVPCVCIMKLTEDELEVFYTNQSTRNPCHQGQKMPLSGSPDERVMMRGDRLRLVAPQTRNTPKLHPDLNYYLGYPLLWPDGDVFGTVSLQDFKENPTADRKGELLAEFRHQLEQDLLILLQRHELRLEIERRKLAESELADFTPKEFHSLLTAAQAVLEHRKLEVSARIIFDEACAMTGASAGYVALLNDTGEENELLFLESGGLPCTVDHSLPMPIRSLRAESYHSGKGVYDNDFMHSRWTAYLPEGHVEMKNVMFAPLNISGRTVGIIGLANKDGDFTEFDAAMAEAFGKIAAIALRNSRTLDELDETNRKLEHFNKALVNREMRIVEVKQEVNNLCRELGREPAYKVGTGAFNRTEEESGSDRAN